MNEQLNPTPTEQERQLAQLLRMEPEDLAHGRVLREQRKIDDAELVHDELCDPMMTLEDGTPIMCGCEERRPKELE